METLNELRHAILNTLLDSIGVYEWSVNNRMSNDPQYYFKENGDFFADVHEHDSNRNKFLFTKAEIIDVLDNKIAAGERAKRDKEIYLRHFKE